MASIILWNLHFWTNNGWESACSHKSSWTTCRCFPGEAYLSNVPATQWKPGKARRAKDNCQRLEHAAAFLEAIQNAAQDELFCVYARDTDMLHSPKKGLASAATGASGYTCACSTGAIGALRKKFGWFPGRFVFFEYWEGRPRIPAWGWFSGLPTTVTLVSQESVPSQTTMKPARPSHSRRLMNLTARRSLVFAWAVG